MGTGICLKIETIPVSKIIDKRKNDHSCWKPSIFLMCRWFYFLWGNRILHFPALSISNKAWWKEGWWSFALLVVYQSYKSDWIKWDPELRTLSSITLPAANYFNWFIYVFIYFKSATSYVRLFVQNSLPDGNMQICLSCCSIWGWEV